MVVFPPAQADQDHRLTRFNFKVYFLQNHNPGFIAKETPEKTISPFTGGRLYAVGAWYQELRQME